MTFFIDYLAKTTNLLKEAFKLKKYKAMPIALAIFLMLVMLPITAASLALTIPLYIFGFIFKVIAAPIQHLHGVMHKEGQSVKHATQFIIYFISWGTIFMLYCLSAFMLFINSVIYAIFSILSYLWTFGGFKFHLYADEIEDISATVNGRYRTVLPLMLLLFVIIILFVIPLIVTIATLVPMYIENITVDYAINVFTSSVVSMIPFYLVFIVFYSAIGMCPRPKSVACAEPAKEIEEPKEVVSE